MAKAVINLQKESGGIVKISPVDGTGITEVTVPESGELATKEYADLKVALASFTGANQKLTGSGYQKLPGGLIIQWGTSETTPTGVQVTFPISFTVFSRVVSGASSSVGFTYINSPTLTGFLFRNSSSSTTFLSHWLAVGK